MFSALPMKLLLQHVFRWPIHAPRLGERRARVRSSACTRSSEHASIYTEEEIRQLIEISHKSGHLEADERRLINRVFDFSDAEVREAMVPRTAVAALPVTATLEEAEQAFCECGYSRLPVYRERLDEVVGVLFMKDLMPCLRTVDPVEFDMEHALHPPLFVPATARLGVGARADAGGADAHRLRRRRARRARRHRHARRPARRDRRRDQRRVRRGGRARRSSRSRTAHTCSTACWPCATPTAASNLKLPEEAGYTTMAGFLLAKAGRLLRPGEEVEHEGARFQVEQVERRRIRRIRYTPAATAAGPDGEEAASRTHA